MKISMGEGSTKREIEIISYDGNEVTARLSRTQTAKISKDKLHPNIVKALNEKYKIK